LKETITMTDYKCPPPDKPAQQPNGPDDSSDARKCKLPETTPPDYTDPQGCTVRCNCPPGAGQVDHCLEDLIEKQTLPITEGDKAKLFKAELEQFLTKATAGQADYTQDKYEKLRKQWKEQDREIAQLLQTLKCALDCWWCVVECHICPLLYEMRDAELRLYDEGQWCDKARDLQDLLYWHTRDRDAKERVFNRIKAILAVWEKPAATIEKILTENAKTIADARKAIGTEPSKVLYDIFFKLIPLHMAIAPPKSEDYTTYIDDKYTKLCHCDEGKPLCCCGIEIGAPGFRQRLVGPQPYLIDPSGYLKLLCCLVEHVYVAAKDDFAKASAEVTKYENQIKRYKAVIDNGLKNFEKTARAAVPATIDCDKYKQKEPAPKY
jgi:hypothetical protein